MDASYSLDIWILDEVGVHAETMLWQLQELDEFKLRYNDDAHLPRCEQTR
jgi:hypothetical protein